MKHPLHMAIVVAAIVLFATVSLALAGCAGELPDKSKIPAPATVQPSSSTSVVESQGDQLGRQVASVWAEAMQKLVPLMEGTPPYASIKAQVTQLKDEYIDTMVAMGQEIAALNEEGQQTAYDRTTDVLAGMGSTDWFVGYTDLYNTYTIDESQDAQDFAILLSSFDTLTDYAYFNVLKANNPDEAARLGIE